MCCGAQHADVGARTEDPILQRPDHDRTDVGVFDEAALAAASGVDMRLHDDNGVPGLVDEGTHCRDGPASTAT